MEQPRDCAGELRVCELELAGVDLCRMDGWSLGYRELSARLEECRRRKKKIKQKMARIRSRARRRAGAFCEAVRVVVEAGRCSQIWSRSLFTLHAERCERFERCACVRVACGGSDV